MAWMVAQVVLEDTQTQEEGVAIANELQAKLGISPTDLTTGAYMDMLQAPA